MTSFSAFLFFQCSAEGVRAFCVPVESVSPRNSSAMATMTVMTGAMRRIAVCDRLFGVCLGGQGCNPGAQKPELSHCQILTTNLCLRKPLLVCLYKVSQHVCLFPEGWQCLHTFQRPGITMNQCNSAQLHWNRPGSEVFAERVLKRVRRFLVYYV